MHQKKIIFFLVLFAQILLMSGHLFSPDEEILFRATESLVTDFDFSITPIDMGFGTKKGQDGSEYPQYGIGQPILATPFYLFGEIIYRIFQNSSLEPSKLQKIDYSISRSNIDANSVEYKKRGFLRLGVSLFNSFIAAISAVILFTFLMSLGYEKSSFLTTILYSLATLALPHNRTFFSEPLAALLILASFLCLQKGFSDSSSPQNKIRFFLAAGIFAGYSLLTRTDSIILLSGLIVYFCLKIFYEHKNKKITYTSMLINGITVFAPIFLFGLWVLLLNHIRYGGILSTGYEDQPEGVNFSTPFLAGAYGFLFSIGKGIFFFSPPLILSFFGIKNFFQKDKELGIGLLVSIGLFFIVMGKWQNWAGGWCWGPRHIFQIHVLMAIFISPFFESISYKAKRIIFIIFFIIGFAVQLLGSSVSFIDYYYDFYRTPRDIPSAFALYGEDEFTVMDDAYCIYLLDEKKEIITRGRPNMLQAPLIDSIYIPQNSQWRGNFVMLKLGRHDFFWIKILTRK